MIIEPAISTKKNVFLVREWVSEKVWKLIVDFGHRSNIAWILLGYISDIPRTSRGLKSL